MIPKIIGITGKKFNGKDTLGNYFVEQMNYKRIAFADPLKDACKCIFGFTEEQLYGDKKEVVDDFWRITPRQTLQFVGTDLFRNNMNKLIPDIGNDIWVEVVRKKIITELEKNPNTCFVITDIRFQNELDMIHQLGGKVIRVKRNSLNNYDDQHQSEAFIDKLQVDYEINNDNTKDELFENTLLLFK